MVGILFFLAQMDSLGMSLAGLWPYGPPRRIAMDTTHYLLFVSTGWGVDVLDASLVRQTTLNLNGPAGPLFFDQTRNLLFAASGPRIHVWDFSNPSSVNLLSVVDLPVGITDLDIRDTLLIVTAEDLWIYDMSDPSSPQTLLTEDHGLVPFLSAEAQGNALYASKDNRIFAIDISSPSSPVYMDTSLLGALDMMLEGNRLVVRSPGGVGVFDVTSPFQLQELWRNLDGGCNISDVHYNAQDTLLFVACLDYTEPRLKIYRYQDSLPLPLLSTPLGSLERVADMLTHSGRLYLVRTNFGVLDLDLLDPSAPIRRDSLDAYPGRLITLLPAGSRVHLLTETSLWTLEATGLGTYGYVRLPYLQGTLGAAGDYTFVAVNESLYVYNFTAPDNPYPETTLAVPGRARAMDVEGDFLFVGEHYNYALRVVDISGLPVARETAVVSLPFPVAGLDVEGGYAYIVGWDLGGDLIILDVQDVSNIQQVGGMTDPGSSWGLGVDASGNRCLVTTAGALTLLDVSNPASPQVVWSSATGLSTPARLRGNVVVMAVGNQVIALDLTFPLLPDTVGRYTFPENIWEVHLDSASVVVLLSSGAVARLDFPYLAVQETEPSFPFLRPRLLVDPRKREAVLLAPPGPVEMRWYDVLGRMVWSRKVVVPTEGTRRINLPSLPAGVYFWTFEGRTRGQGRIVLAR